ncbi:MULTISPECIES: ParB/RepB/Spo0J family partition protein [Pacificibacter]|uniref:ParB/RepB/Spo0J family partition protein n=1 Tax=Pacificibacter TaxID=1042323 RepID=UPI001C081651|nr:MULTISPECIES: ParB/RepB/Spo0J family partition protein [Pacificibacter]MBU2936145.1 ParB/RepB/Spo0J family partition protein [Pacificibacter marinus]MDO6615005.1 ParB/RepB/Spo0J family partition protein [Pacificibacter sp. 1_MG-2023]
MSQSPKKLNKPRGLGRGLSALMADIPNDPVVVDSESGARRADMIVPIECVEPNPDQPRRQFVQEDLDDLANSIREKGVIQPLIVRPSPRVDGNFEIVAGERRWRASQLAKRHDIPIIVREYDDIEVLEVAIIENIQRADLNSIEEAAGYKQLMEKFGHTQEKLAEALGKSRSHIANLMRLLQLPDDVQNFVVSGDLSAGHARALITSENPSDLARIAVKKGLSVRDTEKLAKQEKSPSAPKARATKPASEKDADTRALEGDLSAAIGMSISIAHKPGTESGILSISYKDLDDLDALCQILSRGL